MFHQYVHDYPGLFLADKVMAAGVLIYFLLYCFMPRLWSTRLVLNTINGGEESEVQYDPQYFLTPFGGKRFLKKEIAELRKIDFVIVEAGIIGPLSNFRDMKPTTKKQNLKQIPVHH